VGTYGLMLRENFKWKNHKEESINASIGADDVVVVMKLL
jgi:hypothetical protein